MLHSTVGPFGSSQGNVVSCNSGGSRCWFLCTTAGQPCLRCCWWLCYAEAKKKRRKLFFQATVQLRRLRHLTRKWALWPQPRTFEWGKLNELSECRATRRLWLLGALWAALFVSHQNDWCCSWLLAGSQADLGHVPPSFALSFLEELLSVDTVRWCIAADIKAVSCFCVCVCVRNTAWCSWDLASLIMLLILTSAFCSWCFSCCFFDCQNEYENVPWKIFYIWTS